MHRIQKALIFGFHLEENFSAYSCLSTICFVFFLFLSLFLYTQSMHGTPKLTFCFFLPMFLSLQLFIIFILEICFTFLLQALDAGSRWKKSLFRFNLAVYTHITLAAFGQPNVYPSHLAFVLCPLASSFLFCKLCSSGVPKLILFVCKDSRTGKQDFETHWARAKDLAWCWNPSADRLSSISLWVFFSKQGNGWSGSSGRSGGSGN